jgi:uncharacterized membrane protein YagU involved in acid resistance
MNARTILVGGSLASLVMAMSEMLAETVLPDGAGFLGPPIAIGATMIRDLQGASNPIPFDLAALVLGLVGHMMNSVILAAVFGVLVGGRELRPSALVAAGAAWGAAVFVAMWLVVAPAVDPLVRNLNGPAFLAGHVMWGAALGLLRSRLGGAQRSPSLGTA